MLRIIAEFTRASPVLAGTYRSPAGALVAAALAIDGRSRAAVGSNGTQPYCGK